MRVFEPLAPRGPMGALLFGVLLIIPSLSLASDGVRPLSLDIFLGQDGHFDTHKARVPGYEAAGFQARMDGSPRGTVFEPGGHGSEPEDVFWREGFYLPSLDAFVLEFAILDGDLIAGGAFAQAGAATSRYVARWDGTQWTSLGLGMNNWVSTLAVYRGELYAGGSFTKADGKVVNYIARWNDTTWMPVGEGMDDVVRTLQVYEDRLYAAGSFVQAGGLLVNHVASWDGESWSRAGTGVNNDVYDLEVYDGKLFACGAFDQAGNEPVGYVASWDGANWSSVGADLTPNPGCQDCGANSMTVYKGSLIIGGDFLGAAGVPVNNMVRYDGADWHAMGSGTNGGIIDVEVVDDDLIAVGPFSIAGGVRSVGVAKWDGTAWQAINNQQLNERGTAIASYDGKLVVSGYFTASSDEERTSLDFIATLENNDWFPLMDRKALGVNGPVWTMAMYEGELIVGGNFNRLGMVKANAIARWDGSRWHPMGEGVIGAIQTINVLDLNVGSGEREKTLYIGGVFNIADGQVANSIAYWDGTNWQPIGDGFKAQQQGGAVWDIEEFRGKLYATGLFNTSGDLPMDSVARWDGNHWRPFGQADVPNPIQGVPRTLHVYNDELLLAGSFNFNTSEGQLWPYLVRWTGRGWFPFQEEAGAFARPVYALFTYQGDLVVGGEFTSVGEKIRHNVTRWDGYAWKTMGAGFLEGVSALATHQGSLIAGGQFVRSGAARTHGVGRWNGSVWEPLGSGLEGRDVGVGALVSGFNSLFVGGNFEEAGSRTSRNFAEWTGVFTPVELASFNVKRVGPSAILAWTIAGEPTDHSGFHVYRGERSTRVRLNQQLLRGRREYTFEDTAPPPGEVEYWLAEVNRAGDISWHGPVVLDPAGAFTPVLNLTQNTPNPFQGSTRIAYEIPVEGPVRISVFDVSGREIARLLDRTLPAGGGEVTWNGKTSSGKTAPSGVYFYRLQTEQGERIKRLIRTQ